MGDSEAKRRRRRRWFERGAAAFEQQCPGTLQALVHEPSERFYVCPLCDRAFPEESLDWTPPALTLEHVPPERVGGREWVLTCERCNNLAGSMLDAHAVTRYRFEEMRDVLSIRVDRDGLTANALWSRQDGVVAIRFDERHNRPGAIEAFRAAGVPSDGDEFNVTFTLRFRERPARVSWLRAGFLAMFAAHGYRFSRDPAVAVVKEQTHQPDATLIRNWAIMVPSTLEPWEWALLEIEDPRCHAVRFRKSAILFPRPGDVDFYVRLAELVERSEGRPAVVSAARSYRLIGREPLFGLRESSGS